MKTITRYEAFDGQQFDSVEDCKAHEAQHVEARLVGLTPEQISAALDRSDVDLADAFEEIGRRCSVARREAGEFRRKPKAAEPAKPTEQSPAEQPGETHAEQVAA